MKVKDIKNKLKPKKKKKKKISEKDYLSTGSTLLNLACTGKPLFGFLKGKYYFIVGDSVSGKTFLSLTCLAEASINPEFDNYRFIYDNSEDGALMNISKFFGNIVNKRIEAPSKKHGENIYSTNIEEFYFHIDDALQKGKPFIYILDSMDSLDSIEAHEKFAENKAAYRRGKSLTGSFGDGKAKKNSANLRTLLTPLRKSGSILIIISQTRDNLGFGFEKKTRSGGRALRFYACLEMWSSVKNKIYKTIKGKKRQLGINCLIKTHKNRIVGWERDITIPIYHSFGIDDIGSCVDYLIEEGHWKKNGAIIRAKDLKLKGKREKIISHIENNNMESDLRMIVGEVWNEIEKQCMVKRKKRYE